MQGADALTTQSHPMGDRMVMAMAITSQVASLMLALGMAELHAKLGLSTRSISDYIRSPSYGCEDVMAMAGLM